MSAFLRYMLAPAALALAVSCSPRPDIDGAVADNTLPPVSPDYVDVVIPPNIAPMNFQIRDAGVNHYVRVTSDAAETIDVIGHNGNCRFPPRAWRRLLTANRGRRIYIDVYSEDASGRWTQYRQFSNRVAPEPIDPYIVYRLLIPNKSISEIKGIFQHNIETGERSALMTLRKGTFGCMNCHTFHEHNPDRFLFHMRVSHPGMVLMLDGNARKVDTKQDPMFRPFAYASWHPDGGHIAATINQYFSYFPSTTEVYYFEAVEKRGDLLVYNVDTNRISTTAAVFENEYIETHPCWSPDGTAIYYVRGKDQSLHAPEDFAKFKFNVMRIPYDVTTDTWGTPETVMDYASQGVSASFPRPSKDGRYVLHILADQTTYPIHQRSSDLCLIDLETKTFRKLDAVNSPFSESYPRWSSNGRWMSFVSSRLDGMSAIPHFAYFDEDGVAHKAFILPQQDPRHYDTATDTYNVVELVKGRVNVSPFNLARDMQSPAEPAEFPDSPRVDAYTGATVQAQPGSHF